MLFRSPIPDGSAFEVTIFAQPNTVQDEVCRVTYGSGVLNGANVNEVDIRCFELIFESNFE